MPRIPVIAIVIPVFNEEAVLPTLFARLSAIFDALEKDGVQKAKPLHYVQMQVYMHGTNVDRALYVAVCKDDDRLYVERVRYNPDVATKAVARGQRIALADRMPPPVSTDPTWYQCRFCPAHGFCHKAEPTRHANCRTCAHSSRAI